MTVLPPPPVPRHKCPGTGGPWDEVPMRLLGTLMECPECGWWWKYREQYQDAADKWAEHYGWFPVSAWDIPARRRIAAHETYKHGTPTYWWQCHPSPQNP